MQFSREVVLAYLVDILARPNFSVSELHQFYLASQLHTDKCAYSHTLNIFDKSEIFNSLNKYMILAWVTGEINADGWSRILLKS